MTRWTTLVVFLSWCSRMINAFQTIEWCMHANTRNISKTTETDLCHWMLHASRLVQWSKTTSISRLDARNAKSLKDSSSSANCAILSFYLSIFERSLGIKGLLNKPISQRFIHTHFPIGLTRTIVVKQFFIQCSLCLELQLKIFLSLHAESVRRFKIMN